MNAACQALLGEDDVMSKEQGQLVGSAVRALRRWLTHAPERPQSRLGPAVGWTVTALGLARVDTTGTMKSISARCPGTWLRRDPSPE